MANKSTVSVEVHPASGSVTKKDVEINGSGVSLKEFLKTAGLSDKGMNVSVNGEPAVLTTHVPKGAKVKLTEAARGS
jgi:sulfur carrier protein ThiS